MTATLTTAAATANLPHDIRAIYSVDVDGLVLKPIDQRIYGRLTDGTTQTTWPRGYSLYRRGIDGLIEVIPAAAGTLTIRYLRGLVPPALAQAAAASCVIASGESSGYSDIATGFSQMPIGTKLTFASAIDGTSTTGYIKSHVNASSITFNLTATADYPASAGLAVTAGDNNELLDVPADYVDGLVSWGAWRYLIDKAAGARAELIQYHRDYALGTLNDALRDNGRPNPDQEEVIIPGHFEGITPLGPDDVRPYLLEDRGW